MDMNSAPQYMLQLYKALEEKQAIRDEEISNLHQLNVTLPGMETNLEKADLIMSFINQGKKPLWDLLVSHDKVAMFNIKTS
jgi:hypothetical protein